MNSNKKNIAVVGVGLIGGSFALQCRSKGLADKIIGIDFNPMHAEQALSLNLVDEMMDLAAAVSQVDLIILAIPVDNIISILPSILNLVEKQVVIDLGSTKSLLSETIKNHPKRGRFVAAHPMWGTEYSGPSAAVAGAFEEKAVILCDLDQSDADAVAYAKYLFGELKMRIFEMGAHDHDLHAAYVSHISHLSSFALANTVLEKEKEDQAIFEMASAGFESTVRLAKSNPDMWTPIFKQNKDNILDVLNEHIMQLKKFKSCLEKENWEYLHELIENANQIRRIIH
jgi:prephenate dehydrogenase